MSILREIFHPKMLIVYLICAAIGGLVGHAFGYTLVGAVIGAVVPLMFVIVTATAGLLFINGLINLFSSTRRR